LNLNYNNNNYENSISNANPTIFRRNIICGWGSTITSPKDSFNEDGK
jgi:hypothetical protein